MTFESRRVGGWVAILGTLLVAAGLRIYDLGAASFWYDEVVTMRLAETPTPAAMLRLLSEIDATRAPLHPLLLQGWLRAFGNSEASGRALSVLFGLGTVALLAPLGRLAFDRTTGRWATWLGVVSPLLVYYSREVRMYALLVFLTTLAWTLLFALRASTTRAKTIGYAVCCGALLFTHPLGLLMWGTLAKASALDARGFFGSRRAWAAVHFGVLAAAAPWLVRYFDHAPEFLTGTLPIRFLLGTPIGFLGGNFLTLAAMTGLIAYGLTHRPRDPDRPMGVWVAPAGLTLWLVLPPTILYAYSAVANPIFGPSRYTLFCAPAFLVLIAQGLARLPVGGRWAAAAGMSALAFATLPGLAYDPDARADWRGFAARLASDVQRDPGLRPIVFVASASRPNVEVETARYYLGRLGPVVDFATFEARLHDREGRTAYLAAGARSLAGLDPSFAARVTAAEPAWTRGPLVFRLRAGAPAPSPGTPPGPGTPGR
ncbi:glycosyltransferase family 39 protein [Paludisphaera mucosa]|uniref:Glycosyltransferase family 39 protein n=1 Tax=Paludisphaera mucosa TaxID=3030827 RepID=A0ABT6FA24_9BACT|nr:glycosyltransferase family 39 protein [Paludisphaera mucosa]MDG3004416.1 glycosyltransferase family 39 protein [Paludisphaera mucosa]